MRFIEHVSQETISMVQSIDKHSKQHRVRQRAHGLLLRLHRHATTELMHLFQVDRMTMYHWFDAWESRHLAGVYDHPKPGRPPQDTPEQQAHMRQWAKDSPKHLNKIGAVVAAHCDRRLSKQPVKRL